MEGNPIDRSRGRPRKTIGETTKKDLDLFYDRADCITFLQLHHVNLLVQMRSVPCRVLLELPIAAAVSVTSSPFSDCSLHRAFQQGFSDHTKPSPPLFDSSHYVLTIPLALCYISSPSYGNGTVFLFFF